MSNKAVENRVDRIISMSRSGIGTAVTNHKNAMQMRADLFEDVLKEIAGGCRDARSLAKEALRANEILEV